MKSNWKKAVLFLLAAVLALSSVSFAARKRYAKKIKISWVPYSIQPTDPKGIFVKKLEAKFNVDLDVWNMDDSKFDEMVALRMAAGEIPDFFRIQKVVNLHSYHRQKVMAVIPNKYLRKYAPHIYKCLKKNAAMFLDSGRLDGKLYGIPSVSPTNIFRLPLVYREDWMKKVGVTKTPDTLAEFESLMYKFAKEDPDGNGKNDTYGLSRSGIAAVCGAYGIPINRASKDDYFVKRGKRIINAAIAPELKKVLALMHKWYKDGVMDPEFITGENAGGYWALSHAFINGRIGYSSHGNYYHWIPAGGYSVTTSSGKKQPCDPGANAKEIALVNPKMKWTYGMPLEGPNGRRGIFQFNRLMSFFAFGKQVERDRRKMQRILAIFDFCSASPSINRRYSYQNGTRGKHWVWLDKKHEEINKLPPYDNQDGYNHRIGCVFHMEMPFPPKALREEWAYKHQMNKYGIESAMQVGVPSGGKYAARLMKMRDQMLIAFITGDKPISYFNRYVKEYRKAGGAIVEKEANDWYKSNTRRR
ncbi:MAG: extracellular solute-binding protein [Bacillota bacterium]